MAIKKIWYGERFLISESVTDELKKFFKKIDPEAREKALIAFGQQLINNAVIGGNAARAPIREGRFRGSGTVFVGSKKVGDTTFLGDGGTPAQSYTEKDKNIVTVGFNTEYAANMHENLRPYGKQFQPGRDASAVEGKFLENHLKSDRDELMKLYTAIYRKNAGT